VKAMVLEGKCVLAVMTIKILSKQRSTGCEFFISLLALVMTSFRTIGIDNHSYYANICIGSLRMFSIEICSNLLLLQPVWTIEELKIVLARDKYMS
jgi:hypothetical protein